MEINIENHNPYPFLVSIKYSSPEYPDTPWKNGRPKSNRPDHLVFARQRPRLLSLPPMKTSLLVMIQHTEKSSSDGTRMMRTLTLTTGEPV